MIKIGVALFILTNCSCAFGTPAPSEYPVEVDAKINILKRTTLQTTTKQLITGTDEGGEISFHSDEKGLLYIVVVIGLSNYKNTKEIYFSDDYKPILFLERKSYYRWDPVEQRLKQDQFANIIEDRYYFKNLILLNWITNRSIESKINSQFDEVEHDILAKLRFYQNLWGNSDQQIDIESFLKTGK